MITQKINKNLVLSNGSAYAIPGIKFRDAIERPVIRSTPDIIFNLVANYFQVSTYDIIKRSNERDVVYKRNITVWLIRKYTDLSLRSISVLFNKNYSTIALSIKTINDLRENDRVVNLDVFKLSELI